MQTTNYGALSPLAEQGRTIYENRLKPMLEPEHTGEAVAIHVDTQDYAVAATHREAARALLLRHAPDGRIVTLTIGPPTDEDVRLVSRVVASAER